MARTPTTSRSRADYTVACICPMGVELAPVEAMLDEQHENQPVGRGQNVYTLGKIGLHNVVIAVMPKTGNNTAAAVATQLLNDFPSVCFTFLVGIGGGVPGEADVRLGDVVVSLGGVVQYDLGKQIDGGQLERTGSINKPPPVLSASVQKLDSQQRRLGNKLTVRLREMLQRYPQMQSEYSFPFDARDDLFLPSYPHQQPSNTCDECDPKRRVARLARADSVPYIHYGVIGSANVVMKDAITREALEKDTHVLCVEMEASGLMDSFPCLVIRGICDYADSHKNKRWQPYAAAAAAAYLKELLSVVAPRELKTLVPAVNVVQHSNYDYDLNLFNAPELDSHQFVGREDILAQIQTTLHSSRGSTDRRVVVLGGMGGVGKTQLAIAHARQQRSIYSSVFWLNATSEVTLKSSLRSVAKRIIPTEVADLDDSQIETAVLNWLSAPDNTQWLLIYDNYDEPDRYPINNYYPYVSQGSIMITSRLPDQVPGRPAQVAVRSFTGISDSLEILSRRSERKNVHDDVYAQHLAKRLAGLPLALASAGAYLHQSKSTWSFQQYLEVYERQWHIDSRRPLWLSEYDKTLYTTWNLSYTSLEAHDPTAAKVLKLLAYFDHQAIWYDLFHAGRGSSLPTWLREISGDSASFESVMRVLVEHCFVEVQISSVSGYSMHACVHDWTLAELNSTLDSVSYWFAFDCVTGTIKNGNWENLELVQHAPLTPHAVRLTDSKFETIAQDIAERRLSNANIIARLLRKQVQLEAGAIMYLRALNGCEKAFGPEDTSTLVVLNDLGGLYEDQGKLEEAKQMYKRALAGYEKALGPEHGYTLVTVNNLGLLYYKQDKLEKAEQMYERALAGKERTLGPTNPSTFLTLHNFGLLYYKQNKLAEAERMYSRALIGYERALGAEHVSTLFTVEGLGALHHKQGELVKADQMYRRALAGYEKTLGAEHEATRRTTNHLTALHKQQAWSDELEHMSQTTVYDQTSLSTAFDSDSALMSRRSSPPTSHEYRRPPRLTAIPDTHRPQPSQPIPRKRDRLKQLLLPQRSR